MTFQLPAPLTRSSLGPAEENQLCGRAAEIRTIADNCAVSRLSVLHAAPGLGISSMLRAGVIPALRRAGYITVYFADWQGRSVAARLRDAVLLAIHEQADGGFFADQDPLRELLARAQSKLGKPIAIVLDQFEDYLRFHWGTDVSDDLDAELANAIGARIGRFVIGFQSSAKPAFERLSQYIPNLMGFAITLPPLTREAGAQLLRQSAAAQDLEIEPAAIDQILAAPSVNVNNADGSHGVHPLYAKLAADCLFEAESNLKSRLARASTLAANKGAETMIFESADSVIHELGGTHIELFFRWLPLLIAEDGRRLPVTEKALLDHAGKWDRFAATLLPLLIEGGFLRSLDMPGAKRLEVARDSAAAVVQNWWRRREADIAARQRAKFRVRSISIAGGAIVVAYLVYLIMSWKQP